MTPALRSGLLLGYVLFKTLKYWFRSGSLSFARGFHQGSSPPLASCRWRGRTVFYRPGTSDQEILYKILFKPEKKREYQAPEVRAPRVILDIGANIGAASLWLSDLYPDAQIYSFEPFPENFSILVKNTRSHPHIHPIAMALGKQDGEQELFASDNPENQGGYSLHSEGINPDKKCRIPVRTPGALFRELGLTQVDLIKIDTEGAEYDILTSLPPELLHSVSWILGELHGNQDFELLAYLSPRFDLSVHKNLHSRLGHFTARRKEVPLAL